MEKLVEKEYLVQKFEGKGGWTYVVIPEISPSKKSKFGWVRVRGFIDDFEISQYKLMPMGNGSLFLPLKAEIRKKIGKKEGDKVKVILFADDSPLELPDELRACLEDEPKALRNFLNFTESEQKFYIDWIYSAKKEETKIERIVKTIERVAVGKKMYDK